MNKTCRLKCVIFCALALIPLALRAPYDPASVWYRTGTDYALFIAVKDYKHWKPLRNPIKDAEALALKLQQDYGFAKKNIEIVRNPDQETILATLQRYQLKTYGPNDQLFIFFTGHGQFNDISKEGFFIPVGAPINDAFQTNYLALTRLERNVGSINCPHILLTIDACYSGTFNESIALDKAGGGIPTWRLPGIPLNDADAKENWIHKKLEKRSRLCITSGGKERTSDGVDHSPLTEAFLNHLDAPDADGIVTVEELVANLKNLQPEPKSFPFQDHQPDGTFLFVRSPKPVVVDPQTIEQRQRDTNAWKLAQSENTPSAYQRYLESFPEGIFRDEAEKALQKLADETEWDIANTKNTADAYRYYLSRFPNGNHAQEARRKLADSDADGIPDAWDDCPNVAGTTSNHGCPLVIIPQEMVLIKGGTFEMGDVMGDKEYSDETLHRVTLGDFMLARKELSFEEFDAFCKGTGRDLPDDEGWGRSQRPVINVDWYDAVEYCNWRSEQEKLQKVYSIDKNLKDPNNSDSSGPKKWKVTVNTRANGYRLPTEAEWEYAARQGGQKVRFGNGKNTADPKEINFDGSNSYKKSYSLAGQYRAKTMPVGSFAPNSLGLYDMSGNVWEWCQDWYGAYPTQAANNPIGADRGSNRVIRGGSWFNAPAYVRVADRSDVTPALRDVNVGFRLARAAVTF